MSKKFDELVSIMQKLRSPSGCPWDHEQTHDTLIPYLLEETYEVIDAIEQKNPNHLKEELGDLLLQIIFHSQIATENKTFNVDDVIAEISGKLIRRHPHVFGNTVVSGADEVAKNWEQIKQQEKETKKTILESVPTGLPALFESVKLSKKAAKTGFDWEKTQDVVSKIEEEFLELQEAIQNGDTTHITHEIGDIFFALVNLCRFLQVQPELAIKKVNQRFRNRFAKMEEIIKHETLDFSKLTAADWDTLWEKAKKELS